ncbi:hypothetical protein TNCV_3560371 [Trichonephila clavipes]|uniref:Uncharacterized protein n=1 Tax=Trichonephila clavipes TaxID=2585209 RepID=A0A8X6WCY1_TRICX|nr:hypothetical protein TNCV_3560371 [Trichonephila clavipes]
MLSETKVCLHYEIRRHSNNLRSLNRGRLSASRKRIFLFRNRRSFAAEQFHSDVSFDAVECRAPNNSKNWQWTAEGDVSA